MADTTSSLIDRLAAEARPVSPLPRPWIRTLSWIGLSLPYLAMMLFVWPAQGPVAAKFPEARFTIEQIAALLTGVTAALAAFSTTVPGYDRRILALPLLPLVVWFGDVGQSCLRDMPTYGPADWLVMAHWQCLAETIAVGMIPAALMVVMLKRGAPLTPRLTAIVGGLAAGGLANVGARLVHGFDASLVVLTWHVGAVIAASAVAGAAGRSFLRWKVAR